MNLGNTIAAVMITVMPVLTLPAIASEPPSVKTVIHAQPLHGGKIDPKLFGNFIELLDDVVPGMWAEMLNDRSFEGVLPAANWCYYDGSPDICDRDWDRNPTWDYDTQNAFNGARSAKVRATRSEPGSLTQSGLAVKKGMAYVFSGFFHADNPALKASVRLKVRLPTDEWLTLTEAELPALSTQWQKQSVRLTSSGATDRVVFELRVDGEGTLWADKLSLMPGDNVQGWRADVVAVTKDVKPALMRWGGSAVDPGAYRWKNGIGERDQRIPFANRVWGRLDPNDVGIDEFCQFCELTGTDPLICVSFSDGPQSAADLVEYCNGDRQTAWGAKRIANGHAAPYRVKYWQVGNEISGDDPQYLKALDDFIRLMKRADPGVAVLSSFPTQRLLEKSGKELAFIAPHHYTPDLEACERDFNHLAQLLDRTPSCGHIRIAVTEWNIDAGSWGLGRGRQMTLAAALMNARYLHVLMRHSDRVEMACRSNLANSYCGAIFETSPAGFGVLKRPSYYVMQLYSRHALPVPLSLEQPKEGPDLFASATPEHKSLVIFAVNQKPEPVNWVFQFEGFAGDVRPLRAEAVTDVLHARQPDVMNHWNAPERVKIIALSPADDHMILPPLSAVALDCQVR